MDFNRRDIENNAIVVAQYYSPTTLTQSAINTAVLNPSTFTIISPRVDYAINTNNTLTVRVEERFNSQQNAGLGGTYLPPPYSNLAYDVNGDGQNVMLTETSILNSKTVNETRFQYTRNWTIDAGNQLPQVNVAGAFVTGGNGLGGTHDLGTHYELQNFTSVPEGRAHHQGRSPRAPQQRSKQSAAGFQRDVHVSGRPWNRRSMRTTTSSTIPAATLLPLH